MHRRSRLILVGIAVAVAAAVTVVVDATGLGAVVWRSLRGLHGIGLVAFVGGAAAFGTSLYLFHRVLRRRARMKAIADLLPRYRPRCLEDEFMFDDADFDDELSGPMPAARSQMRAATRALLVSLEEEMQRESSKIRRTGRPACRRARLRTAGRTESGRRRVPIRAAHILS